MDHLFFFFISGLFKLLARAFFFPLSFDHERVDWRRIMNLCKNLFEWMQLKTTICSRYFTSSSSSLPLTWFSEINSISRFLIDRNFGLKYILIDARTRNEKEKNKRNRQTTIFRNWRILISVPEQVKKKKRKIWWNRSRNRLWQCRFFATFCYSRSPSCRCAHFLMW